MIQTITYSSFNCICRQERIWTYTTTFTLSRYNLS